MANDRTDRKSKRQLKAFQAEARAAAALEFTPDETAEKFATTELTETQKQIVYQYSVMVRQAMFGGQFNRARLAIDEAERLFNPPQGFDALRTEVTQCDDLTAGQIGVLQRAGYFLFLDFVGLSAADLLATPDVGLKTVTAVANWMLKAKSPLKGDKRKNATSRLLIPKTRRK